MSNPIYLRAACFFITNEEVRNVTSAVLIDCLSGGGGKQKVKKNLIFTIFLFVLYIYSDLPDLGVEPGSPALQADSLPTELFRVWDVIVG